MLKVLSVIAGASETLKRTNAVILE